MGKVSDCSGREQPVDLVAGQRAESGSSGFAVRSVAAATRKACASMASVVQQCQGIRGAGALGRLSLPRHADVLTAMGRMAGSPDAAAE
jgi:hypothetical protein